LLVFGSISYLKCLDDACVFMRMNSLWFDFGFWLCMREHVRKLLFSLKRAALPYTRVAETRSSLSENDANLFSILLFNIWLAIYLDKAWSIWLCMYYEILWIGIVVLGMKWNMNWLVGCTLAWDYNALW